MDEDNFEEPILALERRIDALSGMGDDVGIRRQREGLQQELEVVRARVYAGMQAIPALTMASPPSSALGTGLVAARLPDAHPADVMRQRLFERHRVVVKMVEKQWFNGIRISAHVFNTEADVDAALDALRTELA